ncbi:MAG: class I SAM-dependent RNA methyltransferase [Bacteroidales bacterium]
MIPKGCVEKCRGCKHREWSMAESLAQKENFLKVKLANWVDVLEQVRTVNSEKRWGYRSKTTLSTFFDGAGWQFGMWARNELIPIPSCPVHTVTVNRTMDIIRANIPKSPAFPLAFIVLSGAQAVLVIKSKQMPSMGWLNDFVKNQLTNIGIEGFWIHLNLSAGKRIFEKTGWHLIFGSARSTDYNGLLYGPAAFQQLIPELYNQSLTEAKNFLNVNKTDAVIDLYCGTGNSMKQWTSAGANVLGVELGGEAVECAKVNVPEATILRGACRQRVPQLKSWSVEQKFMNKRILMYVNPPRTGLEAEVQDWIVNNGQPAKIAYLSCSPGTLSKNLEFLTRHKYRVKKIIPFDFFPQTVHVECLSLLEIE